MREWIDLISERVLDTLPVTYSPERRSIYLNPSAAEFRTLLQNLKSDIDPETERPIAGTVRALLVPSTQDIIAWDGYFATHGAIIDRYHFQDAFHLILSPDTVTALTLWRYERSGFDAHQVRSLIENNPCLKRIYRAGFNLVINP